MRGRNLKMKTDPLQETSKSHLLQRLLKNYIEPTDLTLCKMSSVAYS